MAEDIPIISDEPAPADERTDEQLIDTFRSGDKSALEILFHRYLNQIIYYLWKVTLIKDEAFIEDIRQEIFLTVMQRLTAGVFRPSGPGSFRAWIYTMAQNICRTMNRRKGRQEINLSKIALDLIPARPAKTDESEVAPAFVGEPKLITRKIEQVLSKLTDTERKLIDYLRAGKPYRFILSDPIFSEYSLAYLKLKIYNTRQKVRKLIK